MYIEPNTTIRVLKNVPLDPTYDHTIYFVNSTAQATYFNSKTKYEFPRQTYQRVNRGVMRIEKQAELLYDCNYIMFKNTAFGSKWFYAFIKSVEYVNDAVSEITFEIDDMQTWFFDYTLDQCFVEREHSETDNIGDNIIDEGLECGDEMVYSIIQDDGLGMDDMGIIFIHNRKLNSTTSTPIPDTPIEYTRGILKAVGFQTFLYPELQSTITSISNWLDSFNSEDEIIAVYQFPKIFLSSEFITPGTPDYFDLSIQRPTFIDGYTPKNKKLFVYPYVQLKVSNNQGGTALFRWEDWRPNNNTATFRVRGVDRTIPAVMCAPLNYKIVGSENMDEGLMLTNFPTVAWSGDAFKAWWVQNKYSAITSLVTQSIESVANIAAGAAMMYATGGAGGALMNVGPLATASSVSTVGHGVNAGENVLASIARMNDLKHAPSQTKGQVQCESFNAAYHRYKYTFFSCTIKKQYAQIIDEFFTRYGYATKRNKIPNRNVRPHWTYTKTIGCTITGSIPADSATHICNIYNNGITFWVNGDEVGNYTLDNSPVVQGGQ